MALESSTYPDSQAKRGAAEENQDGRDNYDRNWIGWSDKLGDHARNARDSDYGRQLANRETEHGRLTVGFAEARLADGTLGR